MSWRCLSEGLGDLLIEEISTDKDGLKLNVSGDTTGAFVFQSPRMYRVGFESDLYNLSPNGVNGQISIAKESELLSWFASVIDDSCDKAAYHVFAADMTTVVDILADDEPVFEMNR